MPSQPDGLVGEPAMKSVNQRKSDGNKFGSSETAAARGA